MPLDVLGVQLFMLVMVGIIGSTICERLGHAGEPRKPKSLTTGIAKGKRKWV